jgi:hypothetical protein
MPSMEKEKQDELSKSLLAESFKVTFEILENEIGLDATQDLLQPYLRNAGIAFVANMRKMFNIEGDDIHTIGVICALGNLFFGIDAKEVDHTDEKIEYVCKECQWQNAPAGLCLMGHNWAKQYIKAVNPNYELTLTQLMPNNDPHCAWVIEKRKD